MDGWIGTALREARSRRGIEIAEVEAATKIRRRYLEAMESEDWGVLPGDVYARGFIRAYASFLGLDGERLVEEYRSGVEGDAAEHEATEGARPAEPSAAPSSSRARSAPSLGLLAAAAVTLLAAVAILAIPDGEEGGGVGSSASPRQERDREAVPEEPRTGAQPAAGGISVRLSATAEVWVCLLDARGRELVNGQVLETGTEEGPFRSGSFTVSLGNGEVSMLIDGREAEIPATPSPIGYSIDSEGNLAELDETARPTCT